MATEPINQFLIILIFIVVTLIVDRKYLALSKKLPSVIKELEKWKGSKTNFIEFKKYQYSQVFWQSAQAISVTIFMIGFVIIIKDFAINVVGFLPWLTWLICSIYPLFKFSNVIIPKASKTSIDNIRLLLENDNQSN